MKHNILHIHYDRIPFIFTRFLRKKLDLLLKITFTCNWMYVYSGMLGAFSNLWQIFHLKTSIPKKVLLGVKKLASQNNTAAYFHCFLTLEMSLTFLHYTKIGTQDDRQTFA